MNEYPQCWQDLDNALAANLDRVLLYGQPGTGKTYYCLNKGLPTPSTPLREAVRLLCTSDMTKGDVEGMWKPNASEWEWIDSVCLDAWTNGSRLVLDELDQASGECLTNLLAICDSSASAVIPHPAKKIMISPREGFQVIATTNATRLSDLPPALLDRFPVRININRPHPEALAELGDKHLAAIADMWISDASNKISLRSFFAFQHARKTLSVETSARLIFPDRFAEIMEAAEVNALVAS
jgi:MoxR-like ATPase